MNTMKNDCRIRLETPADYREVENLTREAFWNVYRPGCLEHYILHSYRGKPDFVPELDFVLEKNGTIIGHVMYVRSEIAADDGRRIPIMTFGPISIAPRYQRMGYGTLLLRHSMDEAGGAGDCRLDRLLWQIRLCDGQHQRRPLFCRAQNRGGSLFSDQGTGARLSGRDHRRVQGSGGVFFG